MEKREGICVEQQNPRQARADEPAPACRSTTAAALVADGRWQSLRSVVADGIFAECAGCGPACQVAWRPTAQVVTGDQQSFAWASMPFPREAFFLYGGRRAGSDSRGASASALACGDTFEAWRSR